MVDLAARTPPPLPATPWMRPLPPAMRFILNGDARVRSAAAAVWGAGFSDDACTAVAKDARATLWLGPDEYLLVGSDEAAREATLAALESALRDLPSSLVDVSHRQFALELSGPHAAAILNGACPLDLDLSAFPVGMCTRTVLAKADIVLWRTRGDAFHVEAWRSFNAYVTALLKEIGREFYLE